MPIPVYTPANLGELHATMCEIAKLPPNSLLNFISQSDSTHVPYSKKQYEFGEILDNSNVEMLSSILKQTNATMIVPPISKQMMLEWLKH